MTDDQIDATGLALFCRLCGLLQIVLNKPAASASQRVMNLISEPSAEIVELSMAVSMVEDHGTRELTEDELRRIVFRTARIAMASQLAPGIVVEHAAPDGATFTVRDLVACVEQTERRSRGSTRLLGGIDVHHVAFAGIECGANGVWMICWDS